MTNHIQRYVNPILIILCGLMISTTIQAKVFKTSSWVTTKGARVVFYQAMEVPMLDISIAFAAGSAYDEDAFGLSTITTQLLNQGSGGLSARAIADALAATGAQFEAESNKDMAVFNLKTLTNPTNLKKATDVYASIINHPNFSIDSFDRTKKQQLMAIAQSEQSPDDLANKTFFQVLYKNHPYAHPTIGYEDTVKAVTIEQVQQFYHRFFVSSNAVIVLVGAINQSTAEGLAENLTKDLPKGGPAPALLKAKPLSEAVNVEVPFPSSQTVVRLGQLGIDHNNSHYFPLQVGNYILGGGSLVSRLAHELREKRGLTYGVSSQFAPMPGRGPFGIAFATRHSQAKTAQDLARETLTSFIKTGPNANELLTAKQYLTGSFPLSLASNQSIGNMLLKIAFYRLPADYLTTYVEHINAVTTDDIKEAFQHVITPDKLLQVAVGKR